MVNTVDRLHLDPLQISLSNPLTIPVSFHVETEGPFAINPSPSKKRLSRVSPSAAKYGVNSPGYNNNNNNVVKTATGGGATNPAPHNAATNDNNNDITTNTTTLGNARRPSCRENKNRRGTASVETGTAPVVECGELRVNNQPGEGTRQRRGNNRTRNTSTRLVKLLPGQNLQLEVVFLPATASAAHGTAGILQSSFAPGSEVT